MTVDELRADDVLKGDTLRAISDAWGTETRFVVVDLTAQTVRAYGADHAVRRVEANAFPTLAGDA